MTAPGGAPAHDPGDEVLGTTVALLMAGLRGDGEGMDLLMSGADPLPVLACLTGMATRWAVAVYDGEERFAKVLAAWRPGMRLGDLP